MQARKEDLRGLSKQIPAPKKAEMTDTGSVLGTEGQKKQQRFLSDSTATSTIHVQTGHMEFQSYSDIIVLLGRWKEPQGEKANVPDQTAPMSSFNQLENFQLARIPFRNKNWKVD